jgi:hypothetical protein
LAIGLIIAGAFCFRNKSSKEIVSVNLTENLSVSFAGSSGEGYVEDIENSVDLPQKEDFLQWADGLTYEISPNKNLANGDIVQVTVIYDTDEAENLGIQPEQVAKEFVVDGLVDLENQEESTNSLGMETHIIDGVEIPDSWDLTDDEILSYIQYVKGLDDEPTSEEEKAIEDEWIQGTSKDETNFENKTFSSYSFAYSYGISSSQKFKVEQVMQDNGFAFQCTFYAESE